MPVSGHQAIAILAAQRNARQRVKPPAIARKGWKAMRPDLCSSSPKHPNHRTSTIALRPLSTVSAIVFPARSTTHRLRHRNSAMTKQPAKAFACLARRRNRTSGFRTTRIRCACPPQMKVNRRAGSSVSSRSRSRTRSRGSARHLVKTRAMRQAALAQSSDEGGMVGARYQAARAAHRQQRQTFNAKDIIDNLIAVKRGTETDVHLPERAIAQVLGAGKDGVSNLRRVKALLMSSNTPSSKQAWAAIQHQGLADIFDSAISRNVNHGNGQIGDVVSGAKLNSAIERFGPLKLRELLDQEQFNGLMKLRRIIGNATIPISGTVNPSGTATKILNFLKGAGTRVSAFVPGFSTVLDSGSNLLAKASEQAATRRTLDGILRYDGTPASARKIDQQAQEFVRQFVDAGKSGRFVPTSINLTRPPVERKQ